MRVRIGIVSTITFVIVESLWDVTEHRWDPSASRLITKPELWFLTVIVIMYASSFLFVPTIFNKHPINKRSAFLIRILFSWITIAKVPVTVYTVRRFCLFISSCFYKLRTLGFLNRAQTKRLLSECPVV
jgi:hypothetical protein